MGKRLVLGILGLLMVLLLIFWQASENLPPEIRTPGEEETAPAEPLLGEVILERYAHPDGSVQDDLKLIQRVLMTVRTLVKTQDPGRMAVNEDVVYVLLGKNPYKQRLLTRDHPAINANGQLIDRWDSPLFFHLEAADRLDVRSAGPDKRLFTEDDSHLHADGAFMETDKLALPAIP